MHFLAPVFFAAAATAACTAAPTAKTRNGTYKGVHSPEYHQDFFLGVPFAQPPIGDLRFRSPRSLNESWDGAREAVEYSSACVGYGPSQIGYNVSEDCLYLNVVRPSGYENAKLPVALWIHGGGFSQGGGVDLRYNLSFIVDQSVAIGQPIIGVSINYRLSAWGFLNAGVSNAGLRDQRLSLHWLRENVAAFGGDPDAVTIWGQSAGATSVGIHVLAYGGRDDGLFRGAIMESGGLASLGPGSAEDGDPYEALLGTTGCNGTVDGLRCLRELPFAQLNAAINTTDLSSVWGPKLDDDLIQRYGSEQLADGSFVKVPIMIGATTDEGTSSGPKGIDTTQQFRDAVMAANPQMNESFADRILESYPEFSSEAILPNQADDWVPPPELGDQYRRSATYFGDRGTIAPRRLMCETWARGGARAFCFRFNAVPSWAAYTEGATHFVDVAFAMRNLGGVGYAPVRTPPFEGLAESYRELARLMSSDWVAFAATGDPNGWEGRRDAMGSLGRPVPAWPEYAVEKGGCGPVSFVYEGNVTSWTESDVVRKRGISLINSVVEDVYGR